MKDRLIGFNNKQIKYDDACITNPKYYGTLDANGNLVSGIEYQFEGKQLKELRDTTKNLLCKYNYNGEGLRVSKEVNGVITKYYYVGNKLACETKGNKRKNYLYDENGSLLSIIYHDGNTRNKYFYIRDILGNIIGLVDMNGKFVVKYTYDAWGNIKSTTGTLATTLGVENPFIYKGYYYDSEIGRFLNADDVSYLDPSSINGLNLYAYCGNNPIMRIDPYGNAWYHWVVGGIVAIAIVAVAIGTAGAIVAAAPAIAGYLWTAAIAYTGSVALASAAATVVSIGAAVLAVGTITVGINESINVMTGTNLISSAIGQEAYDITSTLVGMGGYMYIMGGMSLPYPSTGRTEPNNLKEQIGMRSSQSNPGLGDIINSSLKDKRFPGWLGWSKFSQNQVYYDVLGNKVKYQIHYVGNRFFPSWYPLRPWFDYKYKY